MNLNRYEASRPEEKNTWVAESDDFPIIGTGNTADDAVSHLRDNIRHFLTLRVEPNKG